MGMDKEIPTFIVGKIYDGSFLSTLEKQNFLLKANHAHANKISADILFALLTF